MLHRALRHEFFVDDITLAIERYHLEAEEYQNGRVTPTSSVDIQQLTSSEDTHGRVSPDVSPTS